MRYQFVDCRWELGNPGHGRERYLAAHVPGASFLDVDEDLAAPPGLGGRHPLPEPETFARAASLAGIEAGVFVIAYGNMGGAERLWWLLRHFGHDDCAVLELEGWLGPLPATRRSRTQRSSRGPAAATRSAPMSWRPDSRSSS